LTCIFVDNAVYMETNFGGNIGSNSTFVETEEECDALGFEDNLLSAIQIYPNPVRDFLRVNINSEFRIQNSKLIITDVLGKILIRANLFQQETTIDLHNLQHGTCFLNVYGEGKILLTKKIIKL